MVGILLSYWGGLFSGATLVSGRVFSIILLLPVPRPMVFFKTLSHRKALHFANRWLPGAEQRPLWIRWRLEMSCFHHVFFEGYSRIWIFMMKIFRQIFLLQIMKGNVRHVIWLPWYPPNVPIFLGTVNGPPYWWHTWLLSNLHKHL